MDTVNDKIFPDLENLGAATGFIEDIFEIIEQTPLFGSFDLSQVEQLAVYMECFGAPTGTKLLQEGVEGDYLMLILTGSVDVVKNQPGEGDKLLTIVGPGGTIGEMSLVDGHKRNASCITREPTDFAVLRRGALNILLNRNPALGAHFLLVLLTEMTRRLREANERLLPHITMTPAMV